MKTLKHFYSPRVGAGLAGRAGGCAPRGASGDRGVRQGRARRAGPRSRREPQLGGAVHGEGTARFNGDDLMVTVEWYH